MSFFVQQPNSFGNQLGSALGNLLGQTGGQAYQGYQQKRSQTKIADMLEEFNKNNPNAPIEQHLRQLYQGGLSPESIKGYTENLNTLAQAQERSGKSAKEDALKQEGLQSNNEILNNLEKLKPYAGNSYGRLFGSKTFGGDLNRPAVQKRQQITSQAIALEGFFRDLATKGTLPKNVFDQLLKRIPNPDMSEREYQGAIDGIREILVAKGLQLPDKKVKPGTKITEQIVDRLLEENGNDPKKAEAQAKKLGYEF